MEYKSDWFERSETPNAGVIRLNDKAIAFVKSFERRAMKEERTRHNLNDHRRVIGRKAYHNLTFSCS
jgi:hypothetical protein